MSLGAPFYPINVNTIAYGAPLARYTHVGTRERVASLQGLLSSANTSHGNSMHLAPCCLL